MILIYSAMKDQRHRAFMHVLFYQAQYFAIGTLRPNYVGLYGALPYMDNFQRENEPNIYNSTRPPPVCETSFGYPSGHCLTTMALFTYIALDYILTRKEAFE